jgi:hypothetical protein
MNDKCSLDENSKNPDEAGKNKQETKLINKN